MVNRQCPGDEGFIEVKEAEANKQHNANNAIHYVKLGKKRRESSKRNYYIVSPRVIIKAIIVNSIIIAAQSSCSDVGIRAGQLCCEQPKIRCIESDFFIKLKKLDVHDRVITSMENLGDYVYASL